MPYLMESSEQLGNLKLREVKLPLQRHIAKTKQDVGPHKWDCICPVTTSQEKGEDAVESLRMGQRTTTKHIQRRKASLLF